MNRRAFFQKHKKTSYQPQTFEWFNLLKCLSQRPRKVGAKFSGTGMAPDEHQQIQLSMDYDGKRDRWNGYDPEEHMRIVEEYSKVDLVSHVV